jgi:RNA recognition motif-containing protein
MLYLPMEFIMHRQIQIGNLSELVDDCDLASLFSPYGEVFRATVAKHLDTGISMGTGLVEMVNDHDGNAAVAGLSGSENRGAVLTVCWSRKSYVGPKAGGFGDRGGTDRMGD